MPKDSTCLLAAELARIQFFARREAQASSRNFWVTVGAVVGISLVGTFLLKPVSLFIIEHFGTRACLFAWAAALLAGVFAVKFAVQYLGRSWEKALHDRVNAEMRFSRCAQEQTE